MADRQSYTRNYYIDEGGDSTLFSRSGKVLIGSEGCSRLFILGVLEVPDPAALQWLYERHEDRFVTYLWPAFRVVQDVHDRRKVGYGMYYTQKRPLNAAALAWRQNKKPPRI